MLRGVSFSSFFPHSALLYEVESWSLHCKRWGKFDGVHRNHACVTKRNVETMQFGLNLPISHFTAWTFFACCFSLFFFYFGCSDVSDWCSFIRIHVLHCLSGVTVGFRFRCGISLPHALAKIKTNGHQFLDKSQKREISLLSHLKLFLNYKPTMES